MIILLLFFFLVYEIFKDIKSKKRIRNSILNGAWIVVSFFFFFCMVNSAEMIKEQRYIPRDKCASSYGLSNYDSTN